LNRQLGQQKELCLAKISSVPDNGTLRMDCAQVNDGVTATPQANSTVAVQGATQAIRRDSSGLVLRTVTTTK